MMHLVLQTPPTTPVAPQLTTLQQAIYKDRASKLQAFNRATACRDMRTYMFKKMDLSRFIAVYAIGQVLEHKQANCMMDDFVLMASAERFSMHSNDERMAAFMTAAYALMKQTSQHKRMSLDDASFIHKACDMAREALPFYSDPAIEFACLKLNEVYLARNEGVPFKGFKSLRPENNILQTPQ